jgi:hypothetical protein
VRPRSAPSRITTRTAVNARLRKPRNLASPRVVLVALSLSSAVLVHRALSYWKVVAAPSTLRSSVQPPPSVVMSQYACQAEPPLLSVYTPEGRVRGTALHALYTQAPCVSQPLLGLSSQSLKPAAQAYWHAPPAQLAAVLGRAGHCMPQPPQWATLVWVLVSQPFCVLLSQSAKPVAQPVSVHVEAMHTSVELDAPQVRPQPPQCAALVRVSASQPLLVLPSQSEKPAVQVSAHMPTAHAGTALGAPGQEVPQAPQWEVLVRVSVSQPLVGLSSQLPNPIAQAATPHCPIAQTAVALGGLQVRPQAPQCAVLVRVSTSQPLPGSLSQSAKPAAQV